MTNRDNPKPTRLRVGQIALLIGAVLFIIAAGILVKSKSQKTSNTVEGRWIVTDGFFKGRVVTIDKGHMAVENGDVISDYERIKWNRIRFSVGDERFVGTIEFNDTQSKMFWVNLNDGKNLVAFDRRK